MAIEVNVPDEISDYKEKIIAGLSFRQLLFGSIALGLGVPTCVLLSMSGANDYITMGATMILVVPPFCLGFINIKGYKFETYAKIKLHSTLAKSARPYVTEVDSNMLPIEVEEFRPEIQKMMKEKEQEEAEQKLKQLEEGKQKGGFLKIVDKIKGFRIKKPEKERERKKRKSRKHKRKTESYLIEVREKDFERKRKAAAKALKTTKGAVRGKKRKEKETAEN